jgi:hypothetical protein
MLLVAIAAFVLPSALSFDPSSPPADAARRALVFEDIQPCDQSLCTYLVFIYTEVAGPQSEKRIKSIAGGAFVELVQAQTYSGTFPNSFQIHWISFTKIFWKKTKSDVNLVFSCSLTTNNTCTVAMNDTTAQTIQDLDIVRDLIQIRPAAKITETLYTRLAQGFYGEQTLEGQLWVERLLIGNVYVMCIDIYLSKH